MTTPVYYSTPYKRLAIIEGEHPRITVCKNTGGNNRWKKSTIFIAAHLSLLPEQADALAAALRLAISEAALFDKLCPTGDLAAEQEPQP
jgi:hypothetical protein